MVARLSDKAKELPGTDLDHRIYSERVNALLAVALSAKSAARAPDDSGRGRTATAAASSALALLPVPSAILQTAGRHQTSSKAERRACRDGRVARIRARDCSRASGSHATEGDARFRLPAFTQAGGSDEIGSRPVTETDPQPACKSPGVRRTRRDEAR